MLIGLYGDVLKPVSAREEFSDDSLPEDSKRMIHELLLGDWGEFDAFYSQREIQRVLTPTIL